MNVELWKGGWLGVRAGVNGNRALGDMRCVGGVGISTHVRWSVAGGVLFGIRWRVDAAGRTGIQPIESIDDQEGIGECVFVDGWMFVCAGGRAWKPCTG